MHSGFTLCAGRDGRPRWRYTYRGVVYITDERSRHEITSWRLDGGTEPEPAFLGDGGTACLVGRVSAG
jgi:hypothetical protein